MYGKIAVLIYFTRTVTTLNVNEMLPSGSRRLLFGGSERYSEPFTFERSNMETCKNVAITIKVRELSDPYDPYDNYIEIKVTFCGKREQVPQLFVQ